MTEQTRSSGARGAPGEVTGGRRRHGGPGARRRILDAAEEHFARDGFDATPTARIAARAGVPKGLLFYYFPKKVDVLRTLLAERLPVPPLCEPDGIARRGDLPGSLLRLARVLDLGRHDSLVLRTIVFREAGTHPEVRHHLRALRDGLLDLTESVLDAASTDTLDPDVRRHAAQTYVAVMLDEASAHRVGGPPPDLGGAARIISAGLSAT